MSPYLLRLSFALCFSASGLLPAAEPAQVWETFTFTVPTKGKDGEAKETTFKVQLAKKEQAAPIRGVMQANGSFMEIAHKHNLAVVNQYDEGKTRGPSAGYLAAAAKACNRPELEFAGAVVIGCSAGGRQAAQWAGFHPERTLAVFLDHSFAGAVHDKPNYDYGNLPIVPGVPMCFSATRDNLYQNANRRELHYNWCTTAFRDHQQPCTTSIYYEPSNHCQVKSRELQAVWLDEVLSLRIPATIPVGKTYGLIPVTIRTGGLVKAELPKDDTGRSYHDEVVIGPAQKVANSKTMNFWVPGPRTAALYVEWVEKNGGRVALDKSDQVPEPPGKQGR